MTIYSQHPNRGEVQILATYADENGLRSTTVTSVDTADLAEPIVDALNRVSACTTVPVSTRDRRNSGFKRYPHDHLVALADRSRRDELLTGTHGLWYKYVKLLLHKALTDLDRALASAPAPVRTAIEAELAAEAGELQAALAEYTGESTEEVAIRRIWESDHPTVLFNGGMYELETSTREQMDRSEEDDFDGSIKQAVDDLRLLFEAHSRSTSSSAQLEEAPPGIFDEPYDQDDDLHGYFLSVHPPRPQYSRPTWEATVNKWVPNDADPDSGSTGEPLITCALPMRPSASEIIDLLNSVVCPSSNARRPDCRFGS